MRSPNLVFLVRLVVVGGGTVLAMGAVGASTGITPSPGTAAGSPVLVELFTSEGCSSCPPADEWLKEIDQAHRIGQAEVIVLSEHVDYWNRLGWVDPYSSALFSDRQKRYAPWSGQGGLYTPQMVIDGRDECIGSDRTRALQAIADAARRPKATVTLAFAPGRPLQAGDPIGVTVRVAGVPGVPAQGFDDVFLAVTESRLDSQVLRGENAGRRLQHTSVVRKLTVLGGLAPRMGDFAAAPEVAIESGWNRNNLRVVVFVQDRRSGWILGAASLALAPVPKPATVFPGS